VSELQGLQLSQDEFRRRGCRVIGIVVDPVETNAQLARDADLDFPVLSDPDLHTIDAYGLRHPSGHDGRDIALSASVLLDANGIVRWTHVTRNFRVRPLPADILAAVDTLALQSPRPDSSP
jgi:peroxiredoxin